MTNRHRLGRGIQGYLTLFYAHAFVQQCQNRASWLPSLLVCFNPLHRGMGVLTVLFFSPASASLLILAHFSARLYQPCEPHWDDAQNRAILLSNLTFIPPPNSCQVTQTHSCALLLSFRRVCTRLHICSNWQTSLQWSPTTRPLWSPTTRPLSTRPPW